MQVSLYIKRFLFAIIMIVLMLPFLQDHLLHWKEKGLKGAFISKAKPEFTDSSWFIGNYQKEFDDWYNENFGFRKTFIRLRNQVGFELFDTAYANGVIVGKDNFLFERPYCLTYTGKDYMGDEAMRELVRKLKAVQDSLEAKGITLVVCIAAGKATFYPELIPFYFGPGAEKTNYKMFAKELSSMNVNTIDFNRWFLDLKKTSPYPLFPKTGIHWSRYGGMLAYDSIMKWVERKRNVNMPDLILDGTYRVDTLMPPDNDIGAAMNLLCPIKPLDMRYFNMHRGDTTGRAKIRLMAITDSYFWQMFDVMPYTPVYSHVDFYYYYHSIYRSDSGTPETSDPEASMIDVSKSNVVMLMATEFNIKDIGWGFIDDAYNSFVLHQSLTTPDNLVKYYEKAIHLDKTWLDAVKKKAEAGNVPLDTMIHLDAVYMMQQRMKGQH